MEFAGVTEDSHSDRYKVTVDEVVKARIGLLALGHKEQADLLKEVSPTTLNDLPRRPAEQIVAGNLALQASFWSRGHQADIDLMYASSETISSGLGALVAGQEAVHAVQIEQFSDV